MSVAPKYVLTIHPSAAPCEVGAFDTRGTPWKRIATYHIPWKLPECPEGGCICVVRHAPVSNLSLLTKCRFLRAVELGPEWVGISPYELSRPLTKCENRCGEPDISFGPIRCKVTGATSRTLAKPQPAVWCEGHESTCVKGAK
jgi:hypothetical protein